MSLRDYHKIIARSIYRDKDSDAGGIVMAPLVVGSLITTVSTWYLIWDYFNSFLYGLLSGTAIALVCWYGLLLMGAYYEELIEELKKDGKL